MDQGKLGNIETYCQAVEMMRIGNRAICKAQEESRQLRVPNVYFRNGELYFELHNRELTKENPFEKSVSGPSI